MGSAPACLQDLLDRAEIADLLNGYAYGIDQRDWSRYRSVFTDQIWVDLGWAGVNEQIPADNWVLSSVKPLGACDATQHRMTNIDIELNGDRAVLRAQMTARHVLVTDGVSEMQTVGGYYEHDVVRTAQGWRISKLRLVITWEEGDRGLFERAMARGLRTRSDVGTQGMSWEDAPAS
jgi:3-phenylpropionate/cinnamic acid dioxygenase small subunit